MLTTEMQQALLIAFQAYQSTTIGKDTVIVLLGIPVARSGGVVGLHRTGTDFSITAATGSIAIPGVSVQDALRVVTYRLGLLPPALLTLAHQSADEWVKLARKIWRQSPDSRRKCRDEVGSLWRD